jgi:hypothetical protein
LRRVIAIDFACLFTFAAVLLAYRPATVTDVTQDSRPGRRKHVLPSLSLRGTRKTRLALATMALALILPATAGAATVGTTTVSDAYQASIYADEAGSSITLAAPGPTPEPPTPAFSWSPANPAGPPTRVDFDASATTCPAAPCTYRWLHAGVEFGTGVKTYFVYQGTGTKTVTLQVTDALFRVASVSRSFSVAEGTPTPTPSPTPTPTPAAPSAAFSWSPANPSAPPTRVDFDASASSCPATPCTYRWLHEDVEFGTGVKTYFVYQATGTKTVTLQVTDALSRVASVTRSFSVAAGTPTPTPTPSPTPAPPSAPTPEPGPVACDASVVSRDSLASMLGTTASSGKTICVTAPLTGSGLSVGTDMPERTRVLAQPADGTVDMVSVNFSGASNITLEGFEFTGNHGVEIGGGSNGIHYVKNRCHDQSTTCVLWGANSNTLIQANRIERILLTSWPTGYGVYTTGTVTNPKVNYNLCDMGNIASGDCFELGKMSGFEFIGNDVKNVKGSSASHADGLMVWDQSKNGVIKDNRFVDISTVLISPDSNDLLIENNLIARAGQRCLDVATNGTSGDVAPLRWTWRNNTVWTCIFEGILQNGSTANRGQQQFHDNIIEDGSTTGVSAASGNVSRTSIGLAGSFVGWTPNWSAGDYVPLSLPFGYESAGYHPVPVGPAACPC